MSNFRFKGTPRQLQDFLKEKERQWKIYYAWKSKKDKEENNEE